MVYKENVLQYSDYYELRESVRWKNFLRAQAEQAIKNSIYTVVAFKDEQPIGMGRLIGDGIYYTVVDVVIKPEYQGKGIGKNIINMILKHADSITTIGGRATVQLIAAKGKEPFYEKMGFQKIPDDSSGYGMRKLILK
ncbi:GNAT family N-acetyltransferase [Clostridium manihotivorum]|uniref:GNAT family N-acetyltransferase n=1 Tax=Clostridium manihotivorum TaxID=2320868 RepID=A0A410DSW9_9CLOT|nr:GNAT family N-acetyltransferase [Clostridium manihotivorum]QAA32363.1 GNAT family N-acetyltransferase [Clostridium manihotivorum]